MVAGVLTYKIARETVTDIVIKLLTKKRTYDAIIIAVSHQDFKEMGNQAIHAFSSNNTFANFDLSSK